MSYGQFIIGPPGSGKSTYACGMAEFLRGLERKVAIVNLDPANEHLPYECDVSITQLITIKEAMKTREIGPNNAMIVAMEYLEENLHWLEEKLKPHLGKYILFDCPGQVELYTHTSATQNILHQIQKWKIRLATVNLVDAHHCVDPTKYLSVLLLSLKTMLHLELPHVNILSKIDLVESYGKLAFDLSYYTRVQDLNYLLQLLNETRPSRLSRLNKALISLIEDYPLVGFYTLCIDDKESVGNIVKVVDKANGFIFGALEEANDKIQMAADSGDILEDVEGVNARYFQGESAF